MIVTTEYWYRRTFGPLSEVVALLPPWGGIIADPGTWGHVPFAKECAKQGKKAVLGRRFPSIAHPNMGDRWAVVIPRTSKGLTQLYNTPEGSLDPGRAGEMDWWIVYPGNFSRSDLPPNFLAAHVPGVVRRSHRSGAPPGVSEGTGPGVDFGASPGAPGPVLAFSDNFFPRPGDEETWKLMLGDAEQRREARSGPRHILSWDEMLLEGATVAQLTQLRLLIEQCDTPLPRAENIRFPVKIGDAQSELCRQARTALAAHGLDTVAVYRERLERELAVIGQKQFADYFLIIADMISSAKDQMLVGPARGSSCGSLVSWMLRITEIDPIKHGLLFERFIDINRADLPDIDIDFPDEHRHKVIGYLLLKYGPEKVAQIGTIMRYKPKSALTDVAKHSGVPLWELDKLKDVMIEHSSGDSRFRNQLSDSFEKLDVGKNLLAKYPVLGVASRLEDHARSAGTHAAGIIVCNSPVNNFCSTEKPTEEKVERAKKNEPGVSKKGMKNVGTDIGKNKSDPAIKAIDKLPGESKIWGAQIDKKMAETLNMLKIDALGLRTLTVIEEACELIGKPYRELYTLPLEDQAVFDLLNEHKYGSVFQFEGLALQSVAMQIKIDCFRDIAAITALCRPGPLSGGETDRWILGKQTGKVVPLHPALEPYTREEYGCIIYQEQVMRVCLEVGRFSWEDVGRIRNLMSKTVGNEAFEKFGAQFKSGAKANGVNEEDAQRIWAAINQMGCLSGDTVLVNPFPNHVTQSTMTIEELATAGGFNPVNINSKKKQQLYSFDPMDKKIKPQRCVDAFYSGHKNTLLLTLANGMSIRATKNHEFLIRAHVWVQLDHLRIGDSVAVMGTTAPTERKSKIGTGSGAHNWWHKLKAGKPLLKRQIAILRKRFKRCQKCKRAPYQETHHRNGNHTDHRMRNLLPVCRKCHRAFHGASIPHSRGKDLAFSKIVSIGNPRHEAVYDVSMPWSTQNFVANGIVVHNSWAFNKSHAVAYGIVSFWTAWFKTHHPTEFAVANLRHVKDDDSTNRILREMIDREKLCEFIPVDRTRSTDRWEFADGALLGPLTGIPGCGAKTAREILSRRANGIKLTPRHENLLKGESKFADYAPTRKRWGHFYDNPRKYFPSGTIETVNEISSLVNLSGGAEWVCIIGRLVKKNLKDKNDDKWLAKRGGVRVPEDRAAYLIFNIEDDTGQMMCCVGTQNYAALGKKIVEEAKIGAWFAVVGNIPEAFKILMVENIRWLK
jgi:DNA polymerase III alpha subunit/intein-like protein with splicing domain